MIPPDVKVMVLSYGWGVRLGSKWAQEAPIYFLAPATQPRWDTDHYNDGKDRIDIKRVVVIL